VLADFGTVTLKNRKYNMVYFYFLCDFFLPYFMPKNTKLPYFLEKLQKCPTFSRFLVPRNLQLRGILKFLVPRHFHLRGTLNFLDLLYLATPSCKVLSCFFSQIFLLPLNSKLRYILLLFFFNF